VPAEFLLATHPYSLAPFVLVLPSHQLFVHAGNETRFLDLAKLDSGKLESPVLRTQRSEPRTYPLQGSCVLLPLLPDASPAYRARVLLLGGGGLPLAETSPAAKSCELLDLGAHPLGWRECAPMPNARVMPDAVLLPDGSVLVVNGSSTGSAGSARDPVRTADVYDPQHDRWESWGAMRVPRLHHATALLLPDGRVLVAGHDREFNTGEYRYPELRGEVLSPPYLFRGPRPELQAAPERVRHGETFAVEVSPVEPVERVTLLRCGSVTRSFNADQRCVGLAIARRTASRLLLEAPPNGAVAPPGPYLLFALNGRGVPSLGRVLRLG
jgi:hypothetical protein